MEKIYNELQLANMDEVVVSTNEKPVLGTWALATCHGILLYDPKTKQAILAHAGSDHMDMVKTMISLIDENHGPYLEYMVVPGNYRVTMDDYSIKEEIENYLNRFMGNNLYFIQMDENYTDVIEIEKKLGSTQFAFDSRTGEFVTNKIKFTLEKLDKLIKR